MCTYICVLHVLYMCMCVCVFNSVIDFTTIDFLGSVLRMYFNYGIL